MAIYIHLYLATLLLSVLVTSVVVKRYGEHPDANSWWLGMKAGFLITVGAMLATFYLVPGQRDKEGLYSRIPYFVLIEASVLIASVRPTAKAVYAVVAILGILLVPTCLHARLATSDAYTDNSEARMERLAARIAATTSPNDYEVVGSRVARKQKNPAAELARRLQISTEWHTTFTGLLAVDPPTGGG
jgi:hypothetical protein